MRLSSVATTITLALSLSTGSVHATTLVLTDTSEQLYRYDDSGNPYFSESGVSGEKATIHKGVGEAMPLGLIAEMVVPEGWHINIPTRQVANMLVSFKGGKTWSHVLREMAEKERLYITVDWTSKIVSIDASDKAKSDMLNDKGSMDGASSNVAVTPAQPVVPRSNDERLMDSLQASNNANVLSYADTLKKQKAERDASNRDLLAKQALVSQTEEAARNSIEESELKLGEMTEKNVIARNEKERLEKELQAAKTQINALNDRLRVVTGDEQEAMTFEDLYAQYENSSVLPFNDSFDYYIKGGHMDDIAYRTPATYIAKPNSLEDILRAWAEPIGFAIQWNTPVRHVVPHKLEFKGDLREASIELFSLFLESDRPLNITFYPDVGESGLIVVDELNTQKRNTPSLNWITE